KLNHYTIFCACSYRSRILNSQNRCTMNRWFFSILFCIASASSLYAATVDTVEIYSHAMHKPIKCVVIRPAILQEKIAPLPVVYLLHGYSGDFSNWINKVPALKSYADDYRLMIVCPDGDYSSWYFDSPVDST